MALEAPLAFSPVQAAGPYAPEVFSPTEALIHESKKVLIGSALIALGCGLLLDGRANKNQAEMFVGAFLLGYGLSTILSNPHQR